MKTALALDSQMVSAYQRCPKLFYWKFVRNISKPIKGKNLDTGTIFHNLFEWANKRLKDGESLAAIKRDTITCDVLKNVEDFQHRMFILKRFLEYWEYWTNAEVGVQEKIIAAEEGFTKKLYEDDEHIFLYEGRVDVVFKRKMKNELEPRLYWKDYKTFNGSYSLYPHQNQFLGYSWAFDNCLGIVDYIGKQAKLTDNTFKRELIKFNRGQLEQWRQLTIATFFDILKDKDFRLRLTSCQHMYGLCTFHELCERSPEAREQLIPVNFVENTEKWQAW